MQRWVGSATNKTKSMNIQDLAILVLLLHGTSAALFSIVIFNQVKRIRENIPPNIQSTRYLLLFLTTVGLLMNMPPLILDIMTMFDPLIRSAQVVKPSGVLIVLSQAFGLVVSSIGWLVMDRFINSKKS